MIPGMDPRMMKQAMKKMGMAQEELEATEVIITCADKEIIIRNPSVQKIKMMGQESYQISGEEEERSLQTTPEITDDDVKAVMEQAGVSEDDAKAAIEKHEGDLAAAILELKK